MASSLMMTQPMRSPADANVLLIPHSVIVRGAPANASCVKSAALRCRSTEISRYRYISSLNNHAPAAAVAAHARSNSAGASTAPVGLCGELTTTRRVGASASSRSRSSTSRYAPRALSSVCTCQGTTVQPSDSAVSYRLWYPAAARERARAERGGSHTVHARA